MSGRGGHRWATLLLVVAFAIFAGACSRGSTPRGLITDQTIDIDGVTRVYDLHVPAAQDGHPDQLPVVVLLHANRSSRDDITGRSRTTSPYARWLDLADIEGAILLIPQGVEGPEGHTGWNDCRRDGVGNPTTNDVSFILSAIDEVAEDHDVDHDRVFATGTSNGGHMAIRLAEEAPERFAGIAVIAAGMPANSQCTSADQPMSVLFMVGTEDPIAPFEGGEMASDRGAILSAADSTSYWLDRNGVPNTPSVTAFADLEPDDGSTVERFDYPEGRDGTRVRIYRLNGGGHAEPSVAAQYRRIFERVVGRQNHDIEMAPEVWSFFNGLDR